MKKVNEKRWALVGKSDCQAKAIGPKDYISQLLENHGDWCRIARVQITEIEEGEEDGKTI